MDFQTIFIIVIIVFFNLLLLNIFRLQNEIYNLKTTKSTDKPLPGLLNENMQNFKNLDSNSDVNKKLNEIASIVPIDINKIEKSKDILLPKYKQIKHT
tara:strand:+ start:6910 stop:7203 length:294 start_codon:yes stop_codon:yes gene_type:complete